MSRARWTCPPGRADERDRLPAGHDEIEAVEHAPAGPVPERHLIEPHLARAVGQRLRVRDVLDLGIGHQHVVDATAGRCRARQLPSNMPTMRSGQIIIST